MNAASRRTFACSDAAFSLLELVVAMTASMIVLGALFLSTMTMQRTLNGTQRYAEAFSDQRRLVDYLSRDMRRSIAMSCTDESGAAHDTLPGPLTIADRATLVLQLPGYYRGNSASGSDYQDALAVVNATDRVDYGDTSGPAPTVRVSFRKVFMAKEGVVCFVREEAGRDEVIVRKADDLLVQIFPEAAARKATIKAWFRNTYRAAGDPVVTLDQVALRNTPVLFKP